MEWILLLLLGSLAAGAAVWASGDKKTDDDEPLPRSETGPRSSPGLPGPAEVREEQDRSKPVVIGESSQLKETLEKAPKSVEGKVVPGGDENVQKVVEDLKKQRKNLRKTKLKVTYGTDEIIARSSPHAHHRRPLQSAEALVEREKANEALEVYERVKKRVPDDAIKEKIETNLDDIRRWVEGLDHEEDEPLSFPEIIIPLSTQALAIEHLSDGLKNISENLADKIADALSKMQPQSTPGPAAPSATQVTEPAAVPPVQIADGADLADAKEYLIPVEID